MVAFLCLPWFTCQLVFPPPHSPSGPSILQSVSDLLSAVLPPVLTLPFKRLPKTTLHPHHHFAFWIKSNLLNPAFRASTLMDFFTLNPVPQQNWIVYHSPDGRCHSPSATVQWFFASHGMFCLHLHLLKLLPSFKTHLTSQLPDESCALLTSKPETIVLPLDIHSI